MHVREQIKNELTVQVELMNKMLSARKLVVALQGQEHFLMKVDGFRPLLKGICEENGWTELEATIDILKTLDKEGMNNLVALAACVEIIEPLYSIIEDEG